MAYVVLPQCTTKDALTLETELLEEYLKIEPIICYEHRFISEGRYWGNSVLKFCLHPGVLIDMHEIIEITGENVKQLFPEPYKPLEKRHW